jgi:hypothetical protein
MVRRDLFDLASGWPLFDQSPAPSDARLKQEVALIHPEAIVRSALDNYLRVDYGRLGLKLMTVQEWEARSGGVGL